MLFCGVLIQILRQILHSISFNSLSAKNMINNRVTRSVLNFVNRIPYWVSWVQCHRAIVLFCRSKGFSWVLHGSKNFSCGNFVDLKLFSCVFPGSKSFSCGYFVGPKFFPWVFHGSKSFSRGYSCGQYFFSWVHRRVHFFIYLIL